MAIWVFACIVLFCAEFSVSKLSVFPSSIPEPAGDLTVFWNGSVSSGDVIAVRCGPEGGSPLYIFNASSSLVVPDLVSLRCTYNVSFESGGVALDFVLVDMEDPYDSPKQAHLQLGGSPDDPELVLVFTSNVSSVPMLEFTVHGATRRFTGQSTTYNSSGMCGKAAGVVGQRNFRNPGFISRVSFGPISQFRDQCVSFRYGQGGLWRSGRYCEELSTTRFLAFADVGSWTADADPRTVVSRMLNDVLMQPHAMVLLPGDVSYAEGHGFRWDQFGTMMEELALASPLVVGVGNHEYDYEGECANDPSGVNVSYSPSWGNFGNDGGGEAAVPLCARFLAPANPGSNKIFWFSVRRGAVRVLMLSSEHSLEPGSPQRHWLEAELRKERGDQHFLVLALHRPLYTRSGGEADSTDVAISLKLREFIEPLTAGKVDVVVVGHAHIFERTCPVLNGRCNATHGAVMFTVGTGGAGCGPPCPGVGPYPAGDDEWSRFYFEGFGYLRFEATNQTMRVQFVESTTGTVLDETILRRRGAK